MRIVVIGASKGIGRQVVKAALEKGYEVVAFSRQPASLGLSHPRLRLQAGNVLDAAALESAITKDDVVICALGLSTLRAIGPPFAKPSYVLSVGTSNVLQAMTAAGAQRFICVTAIGTGDSVRQCTPLTRLVLRRGLRWLFKEKDQQEQLIKASAANWTIIRPSALTNGRAKGALTNPQDLRCGVLTQISRADVAATMLDIVDQKASYRQALIVSYPPRFGDSVRWVAGYLGLG